MISSPAIAYYKYGGTPGVVICCRSGTVESCRFTRLITAHNDSDIGSYDGDTMAGSSCEGEQKTRGAEERTITGIGLPKRFKSF